MTFVQAANYTSVTRRSIDTLVIHDMEMLEKLDTAEACANYFHNQPKGPNGSSAHYCMDVNTYVQCVRDKDVAWAAPGANHDGLQFEHAGYARQTEAQWLDDYSRKMLFEVSAPVFAQKCREYRIPAVFLRAHDLAAQKRGITTHWEVTRAFSNGRGHTDPGPNFPIQRFIVEVQKRLGRPATKPAPQKKPMPLLKRGMKGYNVKIMQRLLNFEEKRQWDDIAADGDFGPRTEAEVKEFQGRAGLNRDGIVGRMTWQALYAAKLMV